MRQIVPYAADTDIPNINMWKVDSPGVTVHATEYIDPVDMATPPRLEQPNPTVVQEKYVNMPTMTDTIPPTSHNMPTPAQPTHVKPVDVHHPQPTHALPAHAMPVPGPAAPPHHSPPFTPPLPGVNHYEVLKRIKAEARRQVEASRQLYAYLASYMTNTAMSSSMGGGSIYSYQPVPVQWNIL